MFINAVIKPINIFEIVWHFLVILHSFLKTLQNHYKGLKT